jgi:hypothetical protein
MVGGVPTVLSGVQPCFSRKASARARRVARRSSRLASAEAATWRRRASRRFTRQRAARAARVAMAC